MKRYEIKTDAVKQQILNIFIFDFKTVNKQITGFSISNFYKILFHDLPGAFILIRKCC